MKISTRKISQLLQLWGGVAVVVTANTSVRTRGSHSISIQAQALDSDSGNEREEHRQLFLFGGNNNNNNEEEEDTDKDWFPNLNWGDNDNNDNNDNNNNNGLIDWSRPNLIDWDDVLQKPIDWWQSIDWNANNNNEWSNFWNDLFNKQERPNTEDGMLDICPIIQLALGISELFGRQGDCTCSGGLLLGDGTTNNGITIQCFFPEECTTVPEGGGGEGGENDNGTTTTTTTTTPVCGGISLDMTLNDSTTDGDETVFFVQQSFAEASLSVHVCIDFEWDDLEQYCFTYTLPLLVAREEVDEENTDSSSALSSWWESSSSSSPTCTATYGSKSCTCMVDYGICIQVDCSEHLPGATMTDTCQPLRGILSSTTTTEEDGNSIASQFLPDWDIFHRPEEFLNNGQNWMMTTFPNINFDDWNQFIIDIDEKPFEWWQTINWDQEDEDEEGNGNGWINFWNEWKEQIMLNDGFLMGEGDDVINRICPILERIVGISQTFGIEGDCTCTGTLDTGLSIGCVFPNECIGNDGDSSGSDSSEMGNDNTAIAVDTLLLTNDMPSTVCGGITLNMTLDDQTFVNPYSKAIMSAGVCIDFEQDDLEEYCFSYTLPLNNNGNTEESSSSLSPTCNASYGSKSCTCGVDHLVCLQVDCSEHLPGAKSDTCQSLRGIMETADQFLPEWDLFRPDYDFVIDLDGTEMDDIFHVDFDTIDWANLDWMDFDWNLTDWTTHDWNDVLDHLLIDNGLDDLSVCSVLQNAIGISEELKQQGSCICDGNIMNGMSIDCLFSDLCHYTTYDGTLNIDGNGQVSITRQNVGDEEVPTICGMAGVKFQLDSLQAVSTEVFIDFQDDELLELSYSYQLPIAGRQIMSSPPSTCTALYGTGSDECTCTVDQTNNNSLCVSIDCSMHQEGAAMKTCQNLDMRYDDSSSTGRNTEADRFLPDFSSALSASIVVEGAVGVDPGQGQDATTGGGGDGSTAAVDGQEVDSSMSSSLEQAVGSASAAATRSTVTGMGYVMMTAVAMTIYSILQATIM